ncbi:MAG: hypothetical protein HFF18_09410 [Oscillospiraceae bacterium]|nr:hypothetical protein [Oscillospiraceae bacterium]
MTQLDGKRPVQTVCQEILNRLLEQGTHQNPNPAQAAGKTEVGTSQRCRHSRQSGQPYPAQYYQMSSVLLTGAGGARVSDTICMTVAGTLIP